MSVGLSGNLRDFGIADVFQLIGQQRKTGVLELTSENLRVQLWFDNGAVVNAAQASGRQSDTDPLGEMLWRCGLLTRERVSQAHAACRASAQTFGRTVVERGFVEAEEVRRVEDLLTRDTIFEVLRWESGSFDFRGQPVEHDRDPSSLLGAEQILMDGLRMIDEWQSFAHHVPSDETVFQRVGRFESYRDQVGDAPERIERAQRLFSLVDGRLSARRVIDLSRLGNFDGTRILGELASAGLIKPLHPEGVRTLRKHHRAVESRRRGRVLGGAVGSIAATVVSLLLLAAAAWWSQGVSVVATATPLETRPLQRLHEAYATRRIRHAVDAYRITEGFWPASIDEVATRGYLEREALAAPPGRPYYSVNRDDGVVLLAPEH